MAATWRGNTYLLVSFPVGIATFVFLVTAISVGLGLAIVWIGVPILAATLVASRWLARFERRRAAIALARADPVELPARRTAAGCSGGCTPRSATRRPGRTCCGC